MPLLLSLISLSLLALGLQLSIILIWLFSVLFPPRGMELLSFQFLLVAESGGQKTLFCYPCLVPDPEELAACGAQGKEKGGGKNSSAHRVKASCSAVFKALQ